MLRSLVGSEMCIRDRNWSSRLACFASSIVYSNRMNMLERTTYEQVSIKEFIVIKRNDQASNSSSDQRWTTASSKSKQVVKRKRLTTLMPILEPSIETEKGLASESRLKTRHPVITPSCEAPEPSIENQQRPSPEEVINAQLQQPCPKAFQSRSQIMVAALLCSFLSLIHI